MNIVSGGGRWTVRRCRAADLGLPPRQRIGVQNHEAWCCTVMSSAPFKHLLQDLPRWLLNYTRFFFNLDSDSAKQNGVSSARRETNGKTIYLLPTPAVYQPPHPIPPIPPAPAIYQPLALETFVKHTKHKYVKTFLS